MNLLPDRLEAAALCEKYARSVPRYTSYPTAVELKTCSDLGPVEAALRCSRGAPLQLYVHLPYCPNLCHFCACNKAAVSSPADVSAYLDRLAIECRLISRIAGGRPRAARLHLGGGSPSLLTVDEFQRLDRLLSAHFEITPQTAKSLEIDPRTFNREKAAALCGLGFTRVSVGVQDFDPEVQRLINRHQSAALSEETIAYLRSAGFKEVGLDLIYGLPGQSAESFRETIRRAAALAPDRLALFGYAHVRWRASQQHAFDGLPLPTPQERLELFLTALEGLSAAGYQQIGLDHFCLPNDELAQAAQTGTLRRSFMGYTPGGFAGTLAIGASSISDLGECLYQNFPDVAAYRNAVDDGRLPVGKLLVRTTDDAVRGHIIERIMCDGAAATEQAAAPFGNKQQAAAIFQEGLKRLEPLAADGLVRLQPDRLEATPLGRLFLRNIASAYDAFLSEHNQAERKSFSQAI